jgi:hypothetical protein
MRRMVGALLLSALAAPGACSGKTVGSDDGGSGSGGKSSKPTPSPVAQCRTYASTWCTRAFNCYVQVGRLDEGSRQYNTDQCVQLIDNKLPCSGVSSVSRDYDKCLTQIKGMACSKWDVPQTAFGTVKPPAICDNALSFE